MNPENHTAQDLPKHVEAFIRDIQEIMQKVEEFQLRLSWKRNQPRKESNDH